MEKKKKEEAEGYNKLSSFIFSFINNTEQALYSDK